jgi:hypothetical protein
MGQKFIDWLVSPAGRGDRRLQVDGEQLFFPNFKSGT